MTISALKQNTSSKGVLYYRFQTCIITVGGAMAVLHTGQEGQGSENDVKSGSEGLENLIAY